MYNVQWLRLLIFTLVCYCLLLTVLASPLNSEYIFTFSVLAVFYVSNAAVVHKENMCTLQYRQYKI